MAEASELLTPKGYCPATRFEEPALDDTDMQILALLAEQSNEGITADAFAVVLKLHPEHAKHRLRELAKRKYIYSSVQWAATSTAAPYHLNDKGRTILVKREII